jgi:hypothetical protein
MRAFTIMLAVAMLGAVSLATTGAILTISQTRHTAMAFGLAGDSATAHSGYQRQPAFADLTAAEVARDGAAPGRDEGRRRLRIADR